MLRYHVAYHLPRGDDRTVVAEVLDFPGLLSQRLDLADARLMIASGRPSRQLPTRTQISEASSPQHIPHATM